MLAVMLACLAISLAAGAGAAAAASLVPLRSGGGENRTARFDSSLVVPDILAGVACRHADS